MYLMVSSFYEYRSKSGDSSPVDYLTVQAWIDDLKVTGYYDDIKVLPHWGLDELVELLRD